MLRAQGVDVVHVHDVWLGGTPDLEILQWAQSEGRIVVTRNYADFAPLVESLAASGEDFPGVLFYASSVRQSDVGAHVRALTDWITAHAAGGNPVASTFGWLR